jgi:hypothetical protein
MVVKDKKYYDDEGEEYDDKNEYLRDRYEDFGSLLCYFHTKGKTDAEIIKIFVNVPTFSAESIKKTIEEAKEVLNLNPFPYEWIYLDCGYKSLDHYSGEPGERYYKWTKWIVEVLEEEAKKAGKI